MDRVGNPSPFLRGNIYPMLLGDGCLSPPCEGGAPHPDRNRGGWGGARINTRLEIPANQTTPACHAWQGLAGRQASKGGDKKTPRQGCFYLN